MGLLPDYDPATGLPVIPDRSRWDFGDFARSFGSGLVHGGSMLLGLPGDMKRMIGDAHDQYVRPIEQRLGYQGPPAETLQQIYDRQPSLTPTTEQAANMAASVFGTPHDPQTEAGALAYKVGERVPALPFLLLGRGGRL